MRPARHQPEVVWALGTFVFFILLSLTAFFVGTKPSAYHPEAHTGCAALRERVKAADAAAALAAQALSTKVAELQNATEQLHQRSAQLRDEVERVSWLENSSAIDKSLDREVADLKAQLRETRAKLRAEQRTAAAPSPDPTAEPSVPPPQKGGLLRSLTQWRCAVLAAGVMGCLSVLGPSSFVRIFLPVVGSTVGGLMASGCLEYYGSDIETATCLLDSMAQLINGEGGTFGYFVWITLVVLGVARWLMGVECSIYAVVDDVVLANPNPNTCAKEELGAPLLNPVAAERPSTSNNDAVA